MDLATRHQSCFLTGKTAEEVVQSLNEYCKTYGAPKILVSDLGPEKGIPSSTLLPRFKFH